jgi:aspartyl-tRNA(Asn)/glutamyl-tRNA(Gln) amidotransferase subunit C
MSFDREAVKHIALLARLELTADEQGAFADQLGHILEHFETLARLDTATIEPTAHVADLEDAYRDDVVSNAPAGEALRANAPARDVDFFKVPKIIE